MQQTWKPVAAGILNIVAGVFTLLGTFLIVTILAGISGSILAISRIADFLPLWLSGFVQFIIIIVLIFILILSALPIIGGAYSIQRKNWRWALTGSIIAILSLTVLGIASTVLVLLSRGEFEKNNRFR